jgi:hypothetical protein
MPRKRCINSKQIQNSHSSSSASDPLLTFRMIAMKAHCSAIADCGELLK